MTVVSTNDTNEISFYKNSQWIKAYALSMGAGTDVYHSFINKGDSSTWNVDKCNGAFCPNFFRHPILDFWSHLPIDEVKLVVYKNQTAVANIVFDGRNTTLESWFSHEKLKSSHWTDLTQRNEASFSIGQNWGRRFYVWSYEESCETDMGWMAITQMSWCDWEKNLPLPTILYSGKSSTTTFNEGLEIGDSMAIFIRLKP
ncbi:Hypothetical predicted protein [Octopus vulgaris]|uniref:Uncharacterized protein n=1 Tax=Octopus vulgaris TaxID=6645 RepID=A0AA36BZ58_OCTVU|nr:Hypothetical predicted protein [Octopus vulgaris]